MTNYVLQNNNEIMIHSAQAAASLSMQDANFHGVKFYDSEKVDCGTKCLTWVVGIFSVAAVITGLMAMYIEATLISYIAFAFPLLTAPCVILQRRQIQWIPVLNDELNKMRVKINDVSFERNRLANENHMLERQVKRMSAVEGRFEHVAKRDRKDVKQLRALIRNNTAILEETKKLHAALEMQNLFSIVLKSDKNKDGTISEAELDQFMVRMKSFGGRKSKSFAEQTMRAAFKASLSQGTITLLHIAHSTFSEDKNTTGKTQGHAQNLELSRFLPNTEVQQLRKISVEELVPPETIHVSPTGLVYSTNSTGGEPDGLYYNHSIHSITDIRSKDSDLKRDF